MVDGRQVAVFLLSDGALHAIDNHDPISRGQRPEPRHRRRPRRRAGRGVAHLQAVLRARHGTLHRLPRAHGRHPRRADHRRPGPRAHPVTITELPLPTLPDEAGGPRRRARRRSARAARARRRGAVPLRLLDGRLRGLPLVRGGLCGAERAPAGDRVAARRRDRGRLLPRDQALPPLDVVQPLPRARLPRGLPDQRLHQARQRRGGAPGRRVHRLPVLHLELPLLGPGLPARPAHRHEVRHVPAPPRGRAGAGLRRRLPHVRDHRREGERGGVAGRPLGRRRPQPPVGEPHAVDHPHRPARRRAGRDLQRQRLVAAARGPALAPRVAHAADPGRRPAPAPRPPAPPSGRSPRSSRWWPSAPRSSTSAGPSTPGRPSATSAARGCRARWRCSAPTAASPRWRSSLRWSLPWRRSWAPAGVFASGRLYIVPGPTRLALAAHARPVRGDRGDHRPLLTGHPTVRPVRHRGPGARHGRQPPAARPRGPHRAVGRRCASRSAGSGWRPSGWCSAGWPGRP